MDGDQPIGSLPGMEANPLGNVPPPSTPPPPPQQAQPQPDPQQMAQMADTVHHAGIGKAFRSLMGNEVNYSVDPQTGKLIQNETPRSGSNLWRSMLAGVLLGGATASKDGAKNFAGGAAEGGAAVVQHGEQQDQLKRAQAGQDFKTQMEAQANQRAGQKSQDEHAESQKRQTLADTQVAFHNKEILHQTMLMHQEDTDWHQRKAGENKKLLDDLLKLPGAEQIANDVSESKMGQLMKEHPEITREMFKPTGWVPVEQPDGSWNHEETFSAVKLPKEIPITSTEMTFFKTAGKIKNPKTGQWEGDGLEKILGKDIWKNLVEGKTLTPEQYRGLHAQAEALNTQADLRMKQDQDRRKEEASIELTKAEVSFHRAQASKIYTDEKEKKLADDALNLSQQNGDLGKLPMKARKLGAEVYNSSIRADVDVLKALPKDPSGGVEDKAQATALYKRIENSQKLRDRLLGVKEDTAAPTPAKGDTIRAERNGKVLYIPKGEVDDFLKDNPDGKIGEQVKISQAEEKQDKIANMLQGSAESFEGEPPSLDMIREDKALFSDAAKKKYIIRPSDFSNPQWKKIGDGKREMPLNISGG